MLFFQHVHDDDGPTSGEKTESKMCLLEMWKESNDHFSLVFPRLKNLHIHTIFGSVRTHSSMDSKSIVPYFLDYKSLWSSRVSQKMRHEEEKNI